MQVGMFRAYSYQPRFSVLQKWRGRDLANETDVQRLANRDIDKIKSPTLSQNHLATKQQPGMQSCSYCVCDCCW